MTNQIDQKVVQRMAKELGITEMEVSMKLFPEETIRDIDTVAKAKEAYYVAPGGSKAKEVALEKWNSLALTQAQKASNTTEAKEAYHVAPGGSKAEEVALEKWIALVTTATEAKEAYHAAPSGSEAEEVALKAMFDLYKKELEKK